MEYKQLMGMAKQFPNVENIILQMAYDRGHSAGEEEVDAIAMGLRHEIYTAIMQDLD